MAFLYLSLLGIVAGAFSGLVGIGGGIILVPALVFLFGFSQQAAQGTTLAPCWYCPLACWERWNITAKAMLT